MGRHSGAALQEIEDGDLDRCMRLAGSRGMIDAARVLQDGGCFILRSGDALGSHLGRLFPEGAGGRIVRMSVSSAAGGDGAGRPREGGYEIVFVRGRRDAGAKENGGARLAGRTRRRLARARPGRRLRLLNLGLGVAVLAAVSAISLAAISPPLGHIFAAGALAPAGIMLIRAASGGGHA